MIDINELRRLAQAAAPGPDGVSLSWIKLLQDFQQGANPAAINELLDRLEEAEADALEQARLNGMGSERDTLRIELNEIRYGVAVMHDTIKALRAKIDPMERHAPSMQDLLESLRCACNYIDKLGGVSQQYRAMLAAPEAKSCP